MNPPYATRNKLSFAHAQHQCSAGPTAASRAAIRFSNDWRYSSAWRMRGSMGSSKEQQVRAVCCSARCYCMLPCTICSPGPCALLPSGIVRPVRTCADMTAWLFMMSCRSWYRARPAAVPNPARKLVTLMRINIFDDRFFNVNLS